MIAVGAEPAAVLRWAYESYPRVAIVASFQAESSVIIDIASKIRSDIHVLTLDTGRLPQETHDMIDRLRERYRIEIDAVQPDPEEVRAMVAANGTNLFYSSIELRRLCCDVRKSRPLEGALRGYDAWITGVRREQAATRADTAVVAVATEHGGIPKIAPLAGWLKRQGWGYIRAHDLPYHSLYEPGYASICCAPWPRPPGARED